MVSLHEKMAKKARKTVDYTVQANQQVVVNNGIKLAAK